VSCVPPPRKPITGIAGCCPHARFTLTASSRPPAPTRAINSRRLRSSMGDFLPDALSEPPIGPCSVFRNFSLPQRGRQVLGANLKCSESRRWACPRELSSLMALDELRIVLALGAADLNQHRRLEVGPWSLDVMAYVVAVLLRRELAGVPFAD